MDFGRDGNVTLVCCYDGVMEDNGVKLVYVGGKQRMKVINPNIVYAHLVEKMYVVVNLRPEEASLTFKFSYPVGLQSIAIDLSNDDDVREMFSGFPNGCLYINIYITIFRVEKEIRENKPIDKIVGTPRKRRFVHKNRTTREG